MPGRVAASGVRREALAQALEVDERAQERRDVAPRLAHDRLDEDVERRERVELVERVLGAGREGRRGQGCGRRSALDGRHRLLGDVGCAGVDVSCLLGTART